MRNYDLTPLFRSTVGFDRMMRLLDSSMRDVQQAPTYPPYNIEKLGEDQYRISMAVAGFADSDIEIVAQNNTLTVSGKGTQEEEEAEQGRYLHRGIARRAFERRFELADTVKVTGAAMENGLLHIELVREVPEEAKPRKIAIAAPKSAAKTIEGKQAA
ncbi:Hsp20 family protein [Oceanibaculum pacificum]|uniref:Heat-shock protein n=1 Tax=Oceanibaculum pacificum TaxID=580166 RepID=A0A154VQ48_9PROT|nr:Hsp20 family protein [Oceanibaculum pacificum]KZD03359.1 heat-shock protein [Oceanibaculum pacificum]